MTVKSQPLTRKILEHARGLPEGFPVQAGGLLRHGNRSSINRALSRLTKRGELYRIGHGVYVLPVVSRWGKSTPLAYPTLKALADQRGESLVVNCGSAANLLGISTQNPMREIYLTSGRTRSYHFGKREVVLRHAPRWQLALGETRAGMALRAIKYFGPWLTDFSAEQLRRVLDDNDRQKLSRVSAPMPSWVANVVRNIANG